MSDARHKIEFEFAGGVLTAKLICPNREGEECSEYEGYCDARDWFDNVSVEEIVEGKVTVPVCIERLGAEEQPEMKLIEPDPGQRVRDERKIIGCFVADLPETVRLMNMAAIVGEVECGRDVTVQDEDLPPQEVYDRYQLALDRLEEAGILQSTYDPRWEMRAYGLTEEGFDRIRDQVVHYLEKRADAEQERAGRGDVPLKLAAERRHKLSDSASILKLPMEPGK